MLTKIRSNIILHIKMHFNDYVTAILLPKKISFKKFESGTFVLACMKEQQVMYT